MNLYEVRTAIAAELAGELEVWTYLPDDPNVLPCLVVGRPRFDVDGQLLTLHVPVYVLGTRMADEDSQRQLDNALDFVLDRFVRSQYAINSVDPIAQTVSDIPYPGYLVTVLGGQIRC